MMRRPDADEQPKEPRDACNSKDGDKLVSKYNKRRTATVVSRGIDPNSLRRIDVHETRRNINGWMDYHHVGMRMDERCTSWLMAPPSP